MKNEKWKREAVVTKCACWYLSVVAGITVLVFMKSWLIIMCGRHILGALYCFPSLWIGYIFRKRPVLYFVIWLILPRQVVGTALWILYIGWDVRETSYLVFCRIIVDLESIKLVPRRPVKLLTDISYNRLFLYNFSRCIFCCSLWHQTVFFSRCIFSFLLILWYLTLSRPVVSVIKLLLLWSCRFWNR